MVLAKLEIRTRVACRGVDLTSSSILGKYTQYAGALFTKANGHLQLHEPIWCQSGANMKTVQIQVQLDLGRFNAKDVKYVYIETLQRYHFVFFEAMTRCHAGADKGVEIGG